MANTQPKSFGERARELVPAAIRKHLIACETLRLQNQPIRDSLVVNATKGETINYDHIGRVLAERLRLRNEVV